MRGYLADAAENLDDERRGAVRARRADQKEALLFHVDVCDALDVLELWLESDAYEDRRGVAFVQLHLSKEDFGRVLDHVAPDWVVRWGAGVQSLLIMVSPLRERTKNCEIMCLWIRV